MKNSLTIATKAGNNVVLSRETDARILAVRPMSMIVVARSDRAAGELQSELKAWGCTAVIFVGPASARALGMSVAS